MGAPAALADDGSSKAIDTPQQMAKIEVFIITLLT
jgi:hypothetical protein